MLLGLSGGMVPCADALILLLFAHAQQKTAFGLLLVLAFGAGMAAVLVGVGLVMVRAGGTLARWQHPRLQRLTHTMPLISAALICGLGLTLLVSACLQNGLFRLNF
jgi:nickel/cobalt transporter (NicO) family protein